MIEEYIAPEWSEFLQKNQLSNFEDIWSRKDEWFEEPNYGRSKKWLERCLSNRHRRAVTFCKETK